MTQFPSAANPGWRYRWLMRAATLVFVAHAIWKSIVGRNTRYVKERTGGIKNSDSTPYWWHAASVGEVQTLWPLLQASLRQQLITDPNTRWLVSTNTTTGFEVLQQRITQSRLERHLQHVYCPIDSVAITQRFISRSKPNNVVMMETEIWPNLYCALHNKRIPITLINARATTKTINTIRPGSRLASTFTLAYSAALSGVQVLARSDEEATRYKLLGSPANQVSVAGDLKFADNRPAQCRSPLADDDTITHYTVAASTHEPEELQLAEHWLQHIDSGLLIIVPRHMERCNQLYKKLCARFPGEPIERRSTGGLPKADSRLYLADTLGELHHWYSGASAVFVGGSLIQRGGHNVLEPSFHGVQVVTGPHTDNFIDAVNWLAARKRITQCADAAGVVRSLQQNRLTKPTGFVVEQDDVLHRYLRLLGFTEPS